jgi:hypothetical protein
MLAPVYIFVIRAVVLVGHGCLILYDHDSELVPDSVVQLLV